MSAHSRLMDLAMSELAGELADSPHPSLDVLAAYHRRSLPEADARTVQDHLVACRECTALLLDLDELAELGREAAVPANPPEETEAVWERLSERLPIQEVAPAPLLPFRPRAARGPVWLWAAAATLLVSTGALGLWVANLRGTVTALTRPQANAQVAELTASPVRGQGQPKEIQLARGERQFLLVLNPGRETTSFTDFAIAIARDGGKPLVVSGLEPGGHFTLTLFRRTTPDGDYDFTLFGFADGRKEVIARYQLKVATAPMP